MKVFACIALTVFFFIAPYTIHRGEGAAGHTGIVRESLDGGGYTYLQIEEGGTKFWIAGPQIKVNVGAKVSFTEQIWMSNFTSKALNRTFDRVLFVTAIQIDSSAPRTAAPSSSASGPISKLEGGYTVEELFARRNELSGKIVKVRGRVAKVSNNILGRTWVHIKDGTGSKGTDDIIFRSRTETAAVGTVIVAQGTLAIDQNFGSGYFYSAIVEDSTFSQ